MTVGVVRVPLDADVAEAVSRVDVQSTLRDAEVLASFVAVEQATGKPCLFVVVRTCQEPSVYDLIDFALRELKDVGDGVDAIRHACDRVAAAQASQRFAWAAFVIASAAVGFAALHSVLW